MSLYSWTISKPGHDEVKQITTLPELSKMARVLRLAGITPTELVTVDDEVPAQGRIVHGRGSADEWSLTWTKVDGEADVID
jgi:hypothetical protein